jgi:hypothetical protein
VLHAELWRHRGQLRSLTGRPSRYSQVTETARGKRTATPISQADGVRAATPMHRTGRPPTALRTSAMIIRSIGRRQTVSSMTLACLLCRGSGHARNVPVRRVTHGDSRSFTEQPAALLTCLAAGSRVAVTSFASRGSGVRVPQLHLRFYHPAHRRPASSEPDQPGRSAAAAAGYAGPG